MTFDSFESSRRFGNPVNLFFFRYGTALNSFFAYTNADRIVSFEGVDYLPIPINMPNISASGKLDKTTLDITTPFDIPLADLYTVHPPSAIINLTIRQGHLTDPNSDFLVVWTGRVLSAAKNVNEAKFTCEPISTLLKKPGLRRNYQYGCPHVLYGPQCKASKVLATSVATVLTQNKSRVTVNPGWNALAVEKYVNGLFEWIDALGNRQTRTILKFYGPTDLGLSGVPVGLSLNQSVDIVLGCAHNMTDCETLHNNIVNYGGHPWIPTKNPMGGNSNPYY